MRELLAISANSKVTVGQEPSILSAAIEDAMKGAVSLAFAIQQSAECPLRAVDCRANHWLL
jgi:hypothetical protein